MNLGLKCLYKATNIDRSAIDFTNQAVLERLDYLVQLVEAQSERISQSTFEQSFYPTRQGTIVKTLNSNLSLDQPYSSPYGGNSTGSSSTAAPEGAANLSEPVDLGFQTYGTCESLLQWPVFGNKYPCSGPQLLIFQSEARGQLQEKHCLSQSSSGSATQLSNSKRRAHEEDALKLAQKFLTHVHIKNPVLEEDRLIDIARNVMEHGFGWDELSCLMVCPHCK